MYIRGWINGVDAKQDKYYTSPNGKAAAWFVPQKDLNKLIPVNIELSWIGEKG